MPISDLCSKELVCVESESTILYAAQLMKRHHVGGVVVVELGERKKPTGILTDRDIVLGVVAENLPATTKVKEIMSLGALTVPKGRGIADVVDKMESKGVRRVVVVDGSGVACGMVSLDDILQLVAREVTGLCSIMNRQIENEKIYKQQASQLLF